MRLAFADGRHYITDMDSKNPTPINKLLSEEYTIKRRQLINPNRATIDAKHGSPLSSSDTVSFQVVDKFGNACSMVNSNYQGFGTGKPFLYFLNTHSINRLTNHFSYVTIYRDCPKKLRFHSSK